jgi:hypothetical protein
MSDASNTTGNSEEGYRTFYLASDLRRVKIALLFFVIPLAGFAFNDYQFFGLTNEFFFFVILRLVIISIVIGNLFLLARLQLPNL